MNRYKYMLIDGSYFLTRNYMVLKYHDDFSFSGLAKSFTQSVVKIFRDFVSADKVVIAWDKWSPECSGYFRNQLIDDYKGDRHYETEEEYEKLANDPETPREVLDNYRRNLDNLKIKNQVKTWILDELGKFGIPSIYLPGYEADDVSRVFCEVFRDDVKKSCIVSRDSDWSYLINPNIDFIDGKDGTVVTYKDMEKISLPKLVPLWKYKAIEDSLYGSHNNMMPSIDKVKIKGKRHTTVISRILNGETDLIIDPELYEKNLSTFNLSELPHYDELVDAIRNIDGYGEVSELNQFIDMTKSYSIDIYGNYYYNNVCNKLDKSLYGVKNMDVNI